jgi:phenylpropionate dioxygenase-like ring-hydroxylating dioxygenase large terminal subunit
MTDLKIPVVAARPTVIHGAAPGGPRPITGERYVSAEWLDLERRELWPKMWLFAGLERDVAEPGEYLVLNLGDESLLVSRTDDGDLAAFYNVCQHRGARIMVNQRGWVRDFVCPYHGWTYDHAGTLTVVPDADRFTPPVDCAARSLQPIRVEAFSDMVFVCMDPGAPSLLEFLGPLVDIIAPFDLAGMALIGDQTVHLDANWKAVFDNFGELYHVEHIHPQHAKLFDCPTAETHLFDQGHTGVVIDGHVVNTKLDIPDEPTVYQRMALERYGADPNAYAGHILDIRADVQRLRRQEGPRLGYDYSAMTDERLTDVEQYNLFPNTMITLQPDDALIMRARPHPTDPNRCYWDKFSFHRQPDPAVAERAGVAFTPHPTDDRAPLERPEHDEFTQDDIIAGRKTMTITIDQDIHLIRDVQAGMRSRGFGTARLCDDEARVQHYHDWLGHHLGVS